MKSTCHLNLLYIRVALIATHTYFKVKAGNEGFLGAIFYNLKYKNIDALSLWPQESAV